jgi:TonB family protein
VSLRKLEATRNLFQSTLRDFVNTKLATVLALEGRADEAKLTASLAELRDWQPPRPPEPVRQRPQSEIDQRLAENVSATGAIFTDYFRRTPRPPHGTLTLSFTIAPDGSVSDCRTVSSVYDDAQLEGQLADQIRKLRFSPNDPRDRESHTYTITFGRKPPPLN